MERAVTIAEAKSTAQRTVRIGLLRLLGDSLDGATTG
jgi:hypothetical protein